MEILQNRRAILLTDIDEKSSTDLKFTEQALDSTTTLLTKVKSSTGYTRQMRGRADKIEDLQLMVSSADSLNAILDRTGVSFVPDQVRQITLIMEALGAVKTVTFKPIQKPSYVPEKYPYNAMTMTPAEFRQVPELNIKVPGDGYLICPHLEWDSNTASNDATISESVITNTKPFPLPPDTGCRIKAQRRVLASRPLVIRRDQRVMYHVKVGFSLKDVAPEGNMMFESALTSSTVDSIWGQPTGFCVQVGGCRTHKQQLCVWVRYDVNLLTDFPITKNKVGESRALHLCFLLDGDTNKKHVVDVDDVRVISSVTGVVFDRPLWVMLYVDNPSSSDMTGKLVTAQDVTVSQEIIQLLSSLQ